MCTKRRGRNNINHIDFDKMLDDDKSYFEWLDRLNKQERSQEDDRQKDNK